MKNAIPVTAAGCVAANMCTCRCTGCRDRPKTRCFSHATQCHLNCTVN